MSKKQVIFNNDSRIFNIKSNKMFFENLYLLKNKYDISVYNPNTLSLDLKKVPKKIMLDFCRTEKQYNYDAEICLTTMLGELRRMYVGVLKSGQISCPEFFDFTYKGYNDNSKSEIKSMCVGKFQKLNSLIGKIVFIFDNEIQYELITRIIGIYYRTIYDFLENLR